MNLHELKDLIQSNQSKLEDIETQGEDKIYAIEDIVSKAQECSSRLEDYITALDGVENTLEEVDELVADAEYQEVI